MSAMLEPQGRIEEAFQAGRRVGFGISALALGLVAFLSLLGTEKAILAIVLGALAIRGSAPGSPPRWLGVTAICLGSLFVLTVGVVLVVFWDRVVEFIQLLQRIS